MFKVLLEGFDNCYRYSKPSIFILRWSDQKVKCFIDSLSGDEYCTSVLVLAEVSHKLRQKGIDWQIAFDYIRGIMGTIRIYDFTQEDLFDALKNPLDIHINDKIHIAVMKNNGIRAIVSYDRDFDNDRTIKREEL